MRLTKPLDLFSLSTRWSKTASVDDKMAICKSIALTRTQENCDETPITTLVEHHGIFQNTENLSFFAFRDGENQLKVNTAT